MEMSHFNEKLNKVDGKVYVIEEKVQMPENGVYEALLRHDNINVATLTVYTGPQLKGDQLQSFALSTPSLTPWKRSIRIHASVPEVYICYETDGDTVEADDVNVLQRELVRSQQSVTAEENRAKSAEKEMQNSLQDEARRARGREEEIAKDLAEEVERAKTAEQANAKSLDDEKTRAESVEDALRRTIDSNKPVWDDKYTRNEIDNKISAMEAAIDWKKSVPSFGDIVNEYPNPQDGWTVNVNDTDITYRWNGENWIAISANAIQKATGSADGLMSKEDKSSLDDANVKKHTHSNKTVLEKITQAMLDKLGGIADGANKYVHPTSTGNKHLPSGGKSGQILRWSADGTGEWGDEAGEDTKMTQTNTTGSADYRVLLSGNANNTTETATGRKSENFLANPFTGEFFAKGFRRIDITGQTIDINTLNLSSKAPMIARYIERTNGGAAKISNIPVTGQPFLLDVELIRWASVTDYVTMQTFRVVTQKTQGYVRYCTNGTWGAWTTLVFTDTKYTHPNSGAAAGTYRSVTVNAQGHVTGGSNPTTLAGYGITDALKKGALTWNDLGGG